MKLTRDQLKAMREVRAGANVFSPLLARTLRDIEKKAPELLTITKATTAHCDGAGAMPYFGAILTAKGSEALDQATTKKPRATAPTGPGTYGDRLD
jgi:hypothetical protein